MHVYRYTATYTWNDTHKWNDTYLSYLYIYIALELKVNRKADFQFTSR